METTNTLRGESSFKEVLGIIWRQKWILFGTLGVSICFAIALTFVVEPTYQSTGKLIVEGRSTANQVVQRSNDPMQSISTTTTDDVPTQVEQIQSGSILTSALNQVIQANPSIAPKDPSSVGVVAKQIGQTNGIEFTVTSPNPMLSQLVAGQIPESYRQVVQDRNSTELRQGIDFVTGQLEREQETLATAERDLESFRKKNDVSSSPSDGAERNTAVQGARQRLNEAESELSAAAQTFQTYISARKSIPDRIPDSTVEQSVTAIQMAIDRIYQLEGKRRSLLESLLPDSREVREVNGELTAARLGLAEMSKRVDNKRTVRNPLISYYDQQVDSARANKAAAEAKVVESRRYLDDCRAKLDAYAKIVAEMSRQEREIELKRANVSQLTAQLNQLKLFLNQVKDPIQKIQDPTEGVKNRPNPPLYVAIAIFVGSIMAGSIALAKDRLEDKVANVDQAVRLSNAPTLGYVPRLALPRKAVATSALQALPGRTQDNFRILRSNVLFALKEGQEKTIIVTSTTADEGANGVAANLATTIAASGRSAILVDANLVVASQHDRFGLPLSPGLGEVLAATHDIEGTIAETDISNLFVLTAGSCHTNAGDLLGSSEMESLLAALAEKFDVVVIDSPPMTPRSDALALASIADALIYVVKPGATTKTLLKYSLELLGFSRARLLGMVYTDTKFAS